MKCTTVRQPATAGRRGDSHPMVTMSAGEKWMYRVIALSLFILFLLLMAFHQPTDG
jgi:hypothetical protein